jgi:hypothetical protein
MKDDLVFRALPDSFDERCPAREPQPSSWGTSLFAAVYLLSFAGMLIKIVPKFGEVFRQVKVPMPGTTLMLLWISDAACAVPWLVYPMVILLSAAVGRLSKRDASRAQAALSIAFGITALWMVYALFLPLMCCCDHGIGQKRR